MGIAGMALRLVWDSLADSGLPGYGRDKDAELYQLKGCTPKTGCSMVLQGIGWQSVNRRSASGVRLLDHDWRHAAANRLFLVAEACVRSSSPPDSGIQRHPVWNDGRTKSRVWCRRVGFFARRGPGAAEVRVPYARRRLKILSLRQLNRR
jgi:hypothetical protein